MTDESSNEEPDSSKEVREQFSSAYGKEVILETTTRCFTRMVEIKRTIDGLAVILAGLYYTDHQYTVAAKRIRALRTEWCELSETFANALPMLEEINYPVSVNT